MPLDIFRARKDQADRWLRLGLSLWGICLFVILVRLMVAEPGRRSLYPIYGLAGKCWQSGSDLYPTEEKDRGFPLFRYSPGVAALMAPMSFLPFRAADMLWRLINGGALLAGLWGWSRIQSGDPRAALRSFTALLLLVLPLSIGNLNNGQCNTLVLAALLGAMAAAGNERWNLAAVLIALATLFKLYPIAVGLLLVVAYPRRFPLRLIIALALGFALPFLLQKPDYVVRQYALWLHYLRIEDRSTWPVYYTNLDFQLLCRVWWKPISPQTYHWIELASAGFFALACWSARRAGWTTPRLLTLVLGLGSIWMTVFGPATESPTYMLLAPTAAWAVYTAWRDRPAVGVQGLILVSYLLLVSAQIVTWFSGLYLPYRALGPQPVAGLLLAGGLLLQLFSQPDEGLAARFRGVKPGVLPCVPPGSASLS